MKTIVRLFSKGFLVILPFALLMWIVSFLFGILSWGWGHISDAVSSIFNLPYINLNTEVASIATSIAIVVLILVIITYIGFKIEKKERAFFIALGEFILSKVPILNSIYQTIKDLISMISGASGDKYLGVAYVEFGSGELIGFITKKEGEYYFVFIPFAPPTSGLLVRVHKNNLKKSNMSVSEGLKKVVSFGMN